MSSTTCPHENLHDIRRQIDETQQQINATKMLPGERLIDFEYRAKSYTDKILALKIAEQLQLQQIKQAAREAENELLKQKLLFFEEESPYRIRGWRTVRILFLGGFEIQIVARFFATNKPRAEKGKGFYPGLVLTGISNQLSPAPLDLLAKSAAALGSMRDAQLSLADQGIKVSIDRILIAVRAAAFQARTLRSKRVHLVEKAVLAKKGRFRCLLDYYHMKGYLHNMAEAVKDWTKKQRTRWIRKMTKFLFDRDNDSFEREIKALQKNSPKKSVLRTAGNYLLRHSKAGHMNYGEARALKLPIGSGIIESTVRRVVNLRLKGASVYWLESTAEDMLLLRSVYKAGRWQLIEKQGVMVQNSVE